jgi:hypothetical protein
MIKKIVLAIAVAALALSVAPNLSHAKKGKGKPAKCTQGTMASGPANAWGWRPVMMCGADGRMSQTMMMCYGPSSLCPPTM